MASAGSLSPVSSTVGEPDAATAERYVREGDVPGENHAVIKIERNVPVTFYVQGQWQRGLQYPTAPVMENWIKDLRMLAAAKAQPK